jgi:transaldolase
MKIFADTADVEEIKKLNEAGVIDGITTNPTLIMKAGRDFEETVKEITGIVDGPISAEVVSEKAEEMIEEAKPLSKIHKNINIKVPMTGEGLKAIKKLSELGIKTNCTLVFSANQALLAAKAGASFVSPFVGRLDDKGEQGMDVVRDILQVYSNYNFDTKVIVASIRNIEHVKESALLGADIATIPPKIIWKMMDHELTDAGIKRFLDDWEKVKGLKK